jgi:hypothetical protein
MVLICVQLVRPPPKAAASILKTEVNVSGHRVTAGKLANSDGHFLLTEFLDVNAHTTEVGSGLSFAQKLAFLHSAPTSIPEG